jgi:hypothetical protein
MTISYDSDRWGAVECLSVENILPGAVINTTDSPHKSVNSLIPRIDGVSVAGTLIAIHPGHNHTIGHGAHVRKSMSIGHTDSPCGGLDLSTISVGEYLPMDDQSTPTLAIAPPPGADAVDVATWAAINFTPSAMYTARFRIGVATYNAKIDVCDLDADQYAGITWGDLIVLTDLPRMYRILAVPVETTTGYAFGRFYIQFSRITTVFGSFSPGEEISIYHPAIISRRVVR